MRLPTLTAWLCVSTSANVFRYPCSLPYIPHLIGKGGVVSAAIVVVLVIVTRVSSRIRDRRGTHAVYSAYNANERRGECGYSTN